MLYSPQYLIVFLFLFIDLTNFLNIKIAQRDGVFGRCPAAIETFFVTSYNTLLQTCVLLKMFSSSKKDLVKLHGNVD